jgi:hypothetical protein
MKLVFVLGILLRLVKDVGSILVLCDSESIATFLTHSCALTLYNRHDLITVNKNMAYLRRHWAGTSVGLHVIFHWILLIMLSFTETSKQ